MPKRIPFTGEAYWEKVNPYLSQLLTPENGGIQLWTNATRPSGLVSDDEGRTGWNLDAGCLQRWNGSSWINLQPSLTTLGTEIHKIFEEWNPVPPPEWLTNLILNTINDWEPLEYPTWLTTLLEELLDDLELTDIEHLLNRWTPAINSPVDLLIKAAMTTGGLTLLQAENIIINWTQTRAVPAWLQTLITTKLADITFSTLSGRATLVQIQRALNQWFDESIKPWAEEINLEDLDGVITFEQIRDALNKWFRDYLKGYIDNGDRISREHADTLRATLLTKVNKNYEDLEKLINEHSHTGTPSPTTTTTTTTPTPTTTTTPTPAPTTPAPTSAPSSIYWGSSRSVGSSDDIAFVCTGVESSGALSISFRINSATMNAAADITVIRVPGQINGNNNIPSSISYASLLSATGVQTSGHTLNWNLDNPIGPGAVITIGTYTLSSDKGYNVYLMVNSAQRNRGVIQEPLKNIVIGVYTGGSSSPSVSITYTGPSTDTIG